jgi:hypothetical protein
VKQPHGLKAVISRLAAPCQCVSWRLRNPADLYLKLPCRLAAFCQLWLYSARFVAIAESANLKYLRAAVIFIGNVQPAHRICHKCRSLKACLKLVMGKQYDAAMRGSLDTPARPDEASIARDGRTLKAGGLKTCTHHALKATLTCNRTGAAGYSFPRCSPVNTAASSCSGCSAVLACYCCICL